MKRKSFIVMSIICILLSGCRSAGDDVDKQKNTDKMQNETESEKDNSADKEIKLTEEQLNQEHIELKVNDYISVDAYLTPYTDYAEGVNTYKTLRNNEKLYNTDEIYNFFANETKLEYERVETENKETRAYEAGEDAHLTLDRNTVNYFNLSLTRDISYHGFADYKTYICQSVAVEDMLYRDKILKIANLLNVAIYKKGEAYSYERITADKDKCQKYVDSIKNFNASFSIQDDGTEYAVLYHQIDNLPYRYNGINFKKINYDSYNDQIFYRDPFEDRTSVTTGFEDRFEVCCAGDVITDVVVKSYGKTGEKISAETVIDGNEALKTAIKKIGDVNEKVIITSVQLCYDTKIYKHEGMLDVKYYPYWIVDYYDYSREYKEGQHTADTPSCKIIIDAVNGEITDKSLGKIEEE